MTWKKPSNDDPSQRRQGAWLCHCPNRRQTFSNQNPSVFLTSPQEAASQNFTPILKSRFLLLTRNGIATARYSDPTGRRSREIAHLNGCRRIYVCRGIKRYSPTDNASSFHRPFWVIPLILNHIPLRSLAEWNAWAMPTDDTCLLLRLEPGVKARKFPSWERRTRDFYYKLQLSNVRL